MPQVLLEWEGPVVRVRLNRPDKLNAVGQQMATELLQALDEIERRPDQRVMLLTGEGRAFCAGADLGGETRETPEARQEWISTVSLVLRRIRALRCPVVAGVHGYSLGLGCSVAMAADLVIAAEDAIFGFPEVMHGLVPGVTAALLQPLVGSRVATELLLLGERFGGHQARAHGLVNRVVAGQDLESAMTTLADRVVDLSPTALRQTKKLLNELRGLPPREQFAAGEAAVLLGQDTEDAREGGLAFRGKRTPSWTSR